MPVPRAKPVPPRLGPATPPAQALLDWYARHRRTLPWRALPGETPDPYRVWLSEIMLQQTTVEAVKPFFLAFSTTWPDCRALAAAPFAEVMRAWAGLGYYSRARNLHACAALVVERFDGRFPADEIALRALPGIGAYTAAAVAAIAFGLDAVVVDGNVERVMARLHAIGEPLPRARPQIAAAMAALTPTEMAGDFAQAVMDLGSMVCTPRNPICGLCPLRPSCRAAALGTPTAFPVKAARKDQPTRYGTAYVVEDGGGRVLVQDRPPQGLLGGTVEVPGTAWISERAEPGAGIPLGTVVHVFTHFRLELAVFRAAKPPPGTTREGARWCTPTEMHKEAFSTLMRNVLTLAVPETISPPLARPASRTRRRS